MGMKLTKMQETIVYDVKFSMPDFDDDPETILGESDMPDEFTELINAGYKVREPDILATRKNAQTGAVTGHATVTFVRTPPPEKMFEVEAVVDREWHRQGPPCSLSQFLEANPDLATHYKVQIVQMREGERLLWNLGSAGVLRITRVA